MTNVQHATWMDKLALTELIEKYFQLVDDKDFAVEKMQALFTESGTLTRPNDSVVRGAAEIVESNNKSFSRFRATQHLPSGYVVEVVGDEATIRANVMAMHLWADGCGDTNALERHFVGGVVLRASARRTADGWRLTNLGGRNIWRSGSALGMMLPTNHSEKRQQPAANFQSA
jgi:SnoaL-like domain